MSSAVDSTPPLRPQKVFLDQMLEVPSIQSLDINTLFLQDCHSIRTSTLFKDRLLMNARSRCLANHCLVMILVDPERNFIYFESLASLPELSRSEHACSPAKGGDSVLFLPEGPPESWPFNHSTVCRNGHRAGIFL